MQRRNHVCIRRTAKHFSVPIYLHLILLLSVPARNVGTLGTLMRVADHTARHFDSLQPSFSVINVHSESAIARSKRKAHQTCRHRARPTKGTNEYFRRVLLIRYEGIQACHSFHCFALTLRLKYVTASPRRLKLLCRPLKRLAAHWRGWPADTPIGFLW